MKIVCGNRKECPEGKWCKAREVVMKVKERKERKNDRGNSNNHRGCGRADYSRGHGVARTR